jgi:hypothetical protein
VEFEIRVHGTGKQIPFKDLPLSTRDELLQAVERYPRRRVAYLYESDETPGKIEVDVELEFETIWAIACWAVQ